MSVAPRIPLLERESATPDAQKIYDALLAARGVVPNMFKVLGYRPEIAQGVAGFLKPLLSDGALPGSYKELIAIRVSQRHRCAYADAIDDPFYASLKSSFTDLELIELFLTAAAFEMFRRFIDGLRIPVTPPPAST